MVANMAKDSIPSYAAASDMEGLVARCSTAFAEQILSTCQPFLPKPESEIDALDVGCGYGGTSLELAKRVRSVVGIEPAGILVERAREALAASKLGNVSFILGSAETLGAVDQFDLAVLDNVYEHLPNQLAALIAIARALRPGGVLYLLVPNKLWPIEAHYRLPFLSYLPLRWANAYLRLTGRGKDYQDASYAPTYWSLRRQLSRVTQLRWQFVLPARVELAQGGSRWLYHAGVARLCGASPKPSSW